MFTRDNHDNRYNVLVSIDKDAPHVFVKITDKLNYAVYSTTIDHLALQNMMVCQNHHQLYDILVQSFTPPSTFAVNIVQTITQTCDVDIHCELSPEYQLDFAMKLNEQQQTTDERNQTLLLQTTQRYDETISKLVAKLDQLETTVQTQNATLAKQQQTTDERNQTLLLQTTQRYDETISKLVAKLDQLETTVQTQNATLAKQQTALENHHVVLRHATTCIGIGIRNGTHVPVMLSLGKCQLTITHGTIHSTWDHLAMFRGDHLAMFRPLVTKEQLQLDRVNWNAIASLPYLTCLAVRFVNLTNIEEFSLSNIVNDGIKSLHLANYPNATMESLDQFLSLEELVLNDSHVLKSLHQYLPTSLKQLTITRCQPLLEAEKPSLENVCKKRNIRLTINLAGGMNNTLETITRGKGKGKGRRGR